MAWLSSIASSHFPSSAAWMALSAESCIALKGTSD
jgi:hypothetical protein